MFSRKTSRMLLGGAALLAATATSVGATAFGATPSGAPTGGAGSANPGAQPATSRAGYVVANEGGWLFLVRPDGVRTRLTTSPGRGYAVTDVSADAGRILLLGADGRTVKVYDVPSKTWSGFTYTAGRVNATRLSRPTGTAVWIESWSKARGEFIERVSTTGASQLVRLATSHVLPSVDGATFVATPAEGTQFEVRDNARGTLVRRLPTPGGRVCWANRLWDASTIQATCTIAPDRIDVFLVPLNGGATKRLTTHDFAPFGAMEAWSSPRGPIAAQARQDELDGVGYVTSTGGMRPIEPDFGAGTYQPPLTVVAGTLYLRDAPSYDRPATGTWAYDLTTHAVVKLAGGNAAVVDPLH
jgi:hypothetical protein